MSSLEFFRLVYLASPASTYSWNPPEIVQSHKNSTNLNIFILSPVVPEDVAR
jgi:hypothetical protein